MQIFARSFAAFALSVLNAMADERLTAELCTAIASAMNDGDRGARSRWVSMKQMLIDANLARFAQLHPSMLLCHNDNRGGYGLNAFNSHLLGWKIGKVGADLQELLHACCIELSANGMFAKSRWSSTSDLCKARAAYSARSWATRSICHCLAVILWA